MSSPTSPCPQYGEPTLKRRRIRPTSCNGCNDDSRTHQARQKRPFWFDDGDVVFNVEEVLFKIHRHKLRCSVILCDMFELPQPPDADSVDGYPLVVMAGDTARDWMAVLKWMYDPQGFSTQVVVFDIIASVLRIATKYEMPVLRQSAIRELETRWPVDLTSMTFNAFSNASEAISLARECDVPSILPAAFYALSIQRWSCNADGGRSHATLLPHDLRRIISGREYLHDILLQIAMDPLGSAGSYDAVCNNCTPPLTEYWRQKLRPDSTSPRTCWLVKVLIDMFNASDFGNLGHDQLCSSCINHHRSLVWDRLSLLLEEIPKCFKL